MKNVNIQIRDLENEHRDLDHRLCLLSQPQRQTPQYIQLHLMLFLRTISPCQLSRRREDSWSWSWCTTSSLVLFKGIFYQSMMSMYWTCGMPYHLLWRLIILFYWTSYSPSLLCTFSKFILSSQKSQIYTAFTSTQQSASIVMSFKILILRIAKQFVFPLF